MLLINVQRQLLQFIPIKSYIFYGRLTNQIYLFITIKNIQCYYDVEKEIFRISETDPTFQLQHLQPPFHLRIHRSHNTKLRTSFTSLHINTKRNLKKNFRVPYLCERFFLYLLCKENAFYDKFFSLKRFINFEHKALEKNANCL